MNDTKTIFRKIIPVFLLFVVLAAGVATWLVHRPKVDAPTGMLLHDEPVLVLVSYGQDVTWGSESPYPPLKDIREANQIIQSTENFEQTLKRYNEEILPNIEELRKTSKYPIGGGPIPTARRVPPSGFLVYQVLGHRQKDGSYLFDIDLNRYGINYQIKDFPYNGEVCKTVMRGEDWYLILTRLFFKIQPPPPPPANWPPIAPDKGTNPV